jgi:hypothetical protein
MLSAFSAPCSTVDGTEVVEDNNFSDDNDADDNPRLLSDVMSCWEL